MAQIIETPEQQLQLTIGSLVWENTALRAENEVVRKELERARQRIAELEEKDGSKGE